MVARNMVPDGTNQEKTPNSAVSDMLGFAFVGLVSAGHAKVKSVDFYKNGLPKRIEFFEPANAEARRPA
jgi:hypothetical protein